MACCVWGLSIAPSITISVGLKLAKAGKFSSITKKASLVWVPSGKTSTPLIPVSIWK